MEQNPFNFEQHLVADETMSAGRTGMRVAAAHVAGVHGLYLQRSTAKNSEPSPFKDFSMLSQQELLSNQLAQNVVLFPKAQRVQVNEDGIFIPNGVLGRDVQARFRQERDPDGRVRVIVYGVSRGERANIRRREQPVNRSLELQWLGEHRGEYLGMWVALEGGRLLASGENGRAVFDAARLQGVVNPFLVRIQAEEELPFGGW